MFFQMFLLKSIKAYLCPNMIHFDGADLIVSVALKKW